MVTKNGGLIMIDYRKSHCFLDDFYTKPLQKNMVNNIVYYYISSHMFIMVKNIKW